MKKFALKILGGIMILTAMMPAQAVSAATNTTVNIPVYCADNDVTINASGSAKEVPMPGKKTIHVNKKSNYTISFDRPGTYHYLIRETSNVKDPTVYTVHITCTEVNGILKAESHIATQMYPAKEQRNIRFKDGNTKEKRKISIPRTDGKTTSNTYRMLFRSI